MQWDAHRDTFVDVLIIYRHSTQQSDDDSIKSQLEDPPSNDSTLRFDITVVDIYTLKTTVTIEGSITNISSLDLIVQHGYLPATPVNPQLSVSIRTLELYRRLRLCQPSFSIQAFAKVICDLYGLPYRRRYRDALSETFELYVQLDSLVQSHIKDFLGWNTPNWRVLNACPPCNYKVSLTFQPHIPTASSSTPTIILSATVIPLHIPSPPTLQLHPTHP